MQKQRSLKTAGYDAIMMAGIGGAAYGVLWGYVHDWPLVSFMSVGAGLAFAHKLRSPGQPARRHPSAFGSTQFTPFEIKPAPRGGYTARFKEFTPPEFTFWDSDFMTEPVPESILKDIIHAGVKREWQARNGGRNINTAWSREYFTKRYRPRILRPAYDSAIMVMVVTGYLAPSFNGRAPRLLAWPVGPWGLYDGVYRQWTQLQATAPRRYSGLAGRLVQLLPTSQV